jgi:hypothetical protein
MTVFPRQLRVGAGFEKLNDEVTLPFFRPALT